MLPIGGTVSRRVSRGYNDVPSRIGTNTIETGAQNREWRAVAASVGGVSHERTGQLCQDASQWQHLPGGLMVAGIADGAGSAPLGDLGANTAVSVALEFLAGSLGRKKFLLQNLQGWRDGALNLIATARETIELTSSEKGVSSRDLATTLIALCVGQDFVGVLQVGDGAVVVRTEDGELHALTHPGTQEYANETVFVTLPDAEASAQVVWFPRPVTHLAAFTDGLQRLALKLPEGDPFAPFFAPLFRFIETAEAEGAQARLEAFLRSPRVTERADDDLTLLLAARTP